MISHNKRHEVEQRATDPALHTPETIFELIADMPNYGRWLPGSDAFGGTTEVSPYPLRLGTTYLDAGPAGLRPGSVTGYDPRLSSHHAVEARPAYRKH